MNAVRLAASSGAMPRMISVRYVDRVASVVASDGLAAVIDVPVADPDATAEAAPRARQDEATRGDRPCARVPRRSRPAMDHRSVLASLLVGRSAPSPIGFAVALVRYVDVVSTPRTGR